MKSVQHAIRETEQSGVAQGDGGVRVAWLFQAHSRWVTLNRRILSLNLKDEGNQHS